jgi:hypothetical protein
MANVRHTQGMADTGARQEITRFANAKESETVEESKKLMSKTKQRSAKAVRENLSRKRRNVSPSSEQEVPETEGHRRDREASERMVDEGGPNQRP